MQNAKGKFHSFFQSEAGLLKVDATVTNNNGHYTCQIHAVYTYDNDRIYPIGLLAKEIVKEVLKLAHSANDFQYMLRSKKSVAEPPNAS
jgi:hypothetical protein